MDIPVWDLLCFNCIYCASTEVTAAYMWHELLANRGANDVISCLAHFIFCNPLGRTGARWSVWWADNCPGQNKNNFIMWFFQDLIRRNVYSRIDYKFLVVGHTYGPTDRSFGVIEHYTSKVETAMVDHPMEVWVRHTYDVMETPKRVSYYKKRGRQSMDTKPPQLYEQYPIPLKKPKADDLHKLVAKFVPSEYQEFYVELPTNGSDSSDED